jgi:hypothetical protein
MSILHTLVAVSATAGTPTPIHTGTVIVASSFSISKGIATIVLNAASLPSVGYNRGQQVTLWGFTTATYFNGDTVTVIANDFAQVSFSFATTYADVNSTSDAGNTAAVPLDKQRAVRIEADQNNSTHKIYVGDGYVTAPGVSPVTAGRYTACLALAGQISVELVGDNIDASRIFIDTDSTGATVQVTLIN